MAAQGVMRDAAGSSGGGSPSLSPLSRSPPLQHSESSGGMTLTPPSVSASHGEVHHDDNSSVGSQGSSLAGQDADDSLEDTAGLRLPQRQESPAGQDEGQERSRGSALQQRPLLRLSLLPAAGAAPPTQGDGVHLVSVLQPPQTPQTKPSAEELKLLQLRSSGVRDQDAPPTSVSDWYGLCDCPKGPTAAAAHTHAGSRPGMSTLPMLRLRPVTEASEEMARCPLCSHHKLAFLHDVWQEGVPDAATLESSPVLLTLSKAQHNRHEKGSHSHTKAGGLVPFSHTPNFASRQSRRRQAQGNVGSHRLQVRLHHERPFAEASQQFEPQASQFDDSPSSSASSLSSFAWTGPPPLQQHQHQHGHEHEHHNHNHPEYHQAQVQQEPDPRLQAQAHAKTVARAQPHAREEGRAPRLVVVGKIQSDTDSDTDPDVDTRPRRRVSSNAAAFATHATSTSGLLPGVGPSPHGPDAQPSVPSASQQQPSEPLSGRSHFREETSQYARELWDLIEEYCLDVASTGERPHVPKRRAFVVDELMVDRLVPKPRLREATGQDVVEDDGGQARPKHSNTALLMDDLPPLPEEINVDPFRVRREHLGLDMTVQMAAAACQTDPALTHPVANAECQTVHVTRAQGSQTTSSGGPDAYGHRANLVYAGLAMMALDDGPGQHNRHRPSRDFIHVKDVRETVVPEADSGEEGQGSEIAAAAAPPPQSVTRTSPPSSPPQQPPNIPGFPDSDSDENHGGSQQEEEDEAAAGREDDGDDGEQVAQVLEAERHKMEAGLQELSARLAAAEARAARFEKQLSSDDASSASTNSSDVDHDADPDADHALDLSEDSF